MPTKQCSREQEREGREARSGVKDCSWRASSQEGHRFIAQTGNRLRLKKKDVSNMYKANGKTCRVYMDVYFSQGWVFVKSLLSVSVFGLLLANSCLAQKIFNPAINQRGSDTPLDIVTGWTQAISTWLDCKMMNRKIRIALFCQPFLSLHLHRNLQVSVKKKSRFCPYRL